MNRGIVIGRFIPLHMGHLALIDFAAKQCDELIVSVTYKEDDPIPGPLRFGWIRDQFKDKPKIRPELSLDDFDNENLSWQERIPAWAAFITRRFPAIDMVFSSEAYGPLLAASLGVPHVAFDPGRKKFPVSGTLIRQQPFRYWEMIAPACRGFFVKKICLYGPESTGKSTLADKLASIYHTSFVPEVSREFISSNDFTEEDIIRIGYGQTKRVAEMQKKANKLLFCDTDLITTQIYSRHYLHTVPGVLYELEHQVKYDRYYLFDIDVPWVPDGLRDLGAQREEMFRVFKRELDTRKIAYSMVRGSYEEREKFLRGEMDTLLQS